MASVRLGDHGSHKIGLFSLIHPSASFMAHQSEFEPWPPLM